MICCVICGLWYPADARDRLDICLPCVELNFAGNPLDAPDAREALEAYVYPDHQMTPRQAQALARMHVYWQRRQAGERLPSVTPP